MANCKNCKENEQIPQEIKDDFAYVCMNRTIGILIAIVIVCICLIFASNAAWLYAWCQYDYSSEEIVTVDGKDGVANYIGNDGDIVNGENHGSETEKTNP